MRYCPVCNKRFDEDIIKYCTIDGTELIDGDPPTFSAIPSQEEDEIGQDTVIRRRDPAMDEPGSGERIVIPTSESAREQQVRTRPAAAYYPPPPPPPNTAKTVALTILGTVFVLGCGAFMFWLLQGDTPSNINVNTNAPNTNTNLNANFDSNFNFNANANYSSNLNTNFNLNLNTNTRPSPTPRMSPIPTPIAPPSPTPVRTPSTTPRPAVSPTPRTASTPRTGPRPPTNSNR
jgi:hypothetical protein